MKKAQVAIFILVSLILVAMIAFIAWIKANKVSTIEEIECHSDVDCVPNECCGARLCVAVTKKLDCSAITCEPGCNSLDNNYLGCGANGIGEGSCVCNTNSNKCEPYFP